MSITNYPDKYLLFNQEMSKNLSIIMSIEGVDTLFGIGETFTYVRYGDPGLVYGLEGLVYGGLRRLNSVKPYIVLDTSLTIQQRIEPEQGRGNVGTITITLIDKNGEVSQLVAPGIVIDEIIGSKEIKIWVGFLQTSYPEDYVLVYRGYVTSVTCPAGLVKLQISDATSKKRQPLFDTGTTVLSSAIDDTQTTIPVIQTQFFFEHILGPDGNYDSIVRTYINIDNEWMEYGPGDIGITDFTVERGGSHSLGTTPVAHDINAAIVNGIQLGGNDDGENCITLALKILLSGWEGPCETNIGIVSFVYTLLPSLGFADNVFVLANEDALKDLGLTIGDYFTITGATHSGNNISGKITGIADSISPNRVIYTDQIFTIETTTSAVASFRSKYDTLPILAGCKLRMRDVDVQTYEQIRSTYFTTKSNSNMQFFFNQSTDGKTLIDSQILLPVGCYGISRYGRVSMSICKPPLPGGSFKLVELNWTNVLEPDKISVQRATNNRNFFNQVSFQYDLDPVSGTYQSVAYFFDTDSFNAFGQVVSLPIQAPGLVTSIGGATIAQRQGKAILTRYKKCAILIDLMVNWSAGSLLEVSDVVLLRDEGNLKIMNFSTGRRDLGVQLFEVIDRQYNIVSGNVKLKLLGGLGFDIDSRFGLYSPSSNVGVGSTNSTLRIKPSYGQTDLTGEIAKWTKFVGEVIQVHSFDWSIIETTTILGFSSTDAAAILIDPPLSFTPLEDDIVDINTYPVTTDKTDDQLYKTLYTHITPSIAVVSGVSSTKFNVSLGDAAKMTVGNTIIVRNSDYSVQSPEVKVSDISSTLITVGATLGFTPSSLDTVEGCGFLDSSGYYRYS